MSNIVERLRELEAVESELACECDCPPEATANYRYAMTCAEAADEIARLREWNREIAINAKAYADEASTLRAQNAELVAALRRIGLPLAQITYCRDGHEEAVLLARATITKMEKSEEAAQPRMEQRDNDR